MSTSRRAFLGASAATAAHVWIPKPVRGYTAAEVSGPVTPHKAGISKWDLDTPALVVDLDKMERNIAKLQRTLWLARASTDEDDATIVSWYLLDWDAEVARLARRYLHDRPKGPAGTSARGRYLGKRFFADCGLLATLNGQLA